VRVTDPARDVQSVTDLVIVGSGTLGVRSSRIGAAGDVGEFHVVSVIPGDAFALAAANVPITGM